MPPNAIDNLLQMAGGFVLPRCLHIIADLGIADVLGDRPADIADLALKVGANSDTLHRAIRLLAAHGVFQLNGRSVSHTEESRLLREDHPQSLRAFARMFGLAVLWSATQHLDLPIKSGHPDQNRIYPGGFWSYLSEHPSASAIFNAAMEGKAHGQVAGILAAYDFSPFQTIADIGGGRGHLLRAILASQTQCHGILVDLPHVVAESARSPVDRLSFRGLNFLKDQLPSSDAYVIMEVIHDWADSESKVILEAIRRAAKPTSRLLLIEQIVPDDSGPHWTKTLDIHMLALFGGRQRSLSEYQSLLQTVGFRFQREVPTRTGVSILEAIVD